MTVFQLDLPKAEIDDVMAVEVGDPSVLIRLEGNPVTQAALTAGDAGP